MSALKNNAPCDPDEDGARPSTKFWPNLPPAFWWPISGSIADLLFVSFLIALVFWINGNSLCTR